MENYLDIWKKSRNFASSKQKRHYINNLKTIRIMIRKVTIETQEQDFVWVAVLKHKENKFWRDYTEFHVFENIEKARKWATKECHRLLNNIIQGRDIIPFVSSVKWETETELSMFICDENNTLIDNVDVYIYKKEII